MSQVTAQQLHNEIVRVCNDTARILDRDAAAFAMQYAESDNPADKAICLENKVKANQWREAARTTTNCLRNLQEIQGAKP